MLKWERLGLPLHPHDAGRSQKEEIQRLGSAVIIKVFFMSEAHPVTSRKRRLLLTTQNRCLPCSCPLSSTGVTGEPLFPMLSSCNS